MGLRKPVGGFLTNILILTDIDLNRDVRQGRQVGQQAAVMGHRPREWVTNEMMMAASQVSAFASTVKS